MMKYQHMICEECDIPPNFVESVRPCDNGSMVTCVTCRDCGEYWEEPSSDEENFLDNSKDLT